MVKNHIRQGFVNRHGDNGVAATPTGAPTPSREPESLSPACLTARGLDERLISLKVATKAAINIVIQQQSFPGKQKLPWRYERGIETWSYLCGMSARAPTSSSRSSSPDAGITHIRDRSKNKVNWHFFFLFLQFSCFQPSDSGWGGGGTDPDKVTKAEAKRDLSN